MEVPSQISRRSHTITIEDYSNLDDLAVDLESLKNENFILALKAEVVERYLRKRCPSLLVGVEKFLEQAPAMRGMLYCIQTPRTSLSTSVTSHSPTHSITSPHRRASHSLAVSTMSSYSDFLTNVVSKINNNLLSAVDLWKYDSNQSFPGVLEICPKFKIDMVDRELDESRIAMDRLRKRYKSAKFLLETEEENLRSDLMIIGEARIAFENFIKENTDKKTGRIFRDRFLRYIESELQNGDRDLRQLKLKTKTAQIEYNRLIAREEQKIELRERIHPIDLNKLIIENKELQEKFEHQTKVVMDLKKAIGKKGQNLVSMKSKLNDTLLSIKSLRQDIKQKQSKYKLTEQKEIKNVNELITAEIVNQNIQVLNSSPLYKSPDAHSYLRLQVKLKELQSERDIWERRCRNQKQAIDLLEHQIKQLYPPQNKSKAPFSYRTTRGAFSSKSADSIVRRFTHTAHPIHNCTPTNPSARNW